MLICGMCSEYLWRFFLVLVLVVPAAVLQALCQVLVLVLCPMLQWVYALVVSGKP